MKSARTDNFILFFFDNLYNHNSNSDRKVDYIDLKYVRHTSSYAPRLKHRSFSQQGSERSFKSSEKTLTSSLLKNPFTQSRTSLSTPRFFSSTYDTMVHRDKFQKQPKVVYMNIIGDQIK